MSIKYRDSTGTETPVAGLNGTSGELVPSVALYQSGTISVTAPSTSDRTNDYTVPLSTAMPDTDYIVTLDYGSDISIKVSMKNTTSFILTVGLLASTGASDTVTVRWQAFKLMTDQVHEADSAHIAQNTANFAPAFSETTSYAYNDYVTYSSVLYRCTTAHTAGVWDATHFTQVTIRDIVARYNTDAMQGNIQPLLAEIKATADAVSDYSKFEGQSQLAVEAYWCGLKKNANRFHCLAWLGDGRVVHITYSSGTYTAEYLI